MSYPIRWLWLIYRFCISIFIIIFIMLLVFIIIIRAFFNIVNSIFVFVITFIPTDGPMFHKLSFHSFISLAGSFIARQSSSKNLFDLHYTIRDPPIIFLSSYELLDISNAFRPCIYKNLHLLYPEYSAYLFFFYLKMTKDWFCQFLLRISIISVAYLHYWYTIPYKNDTDLIWSGAHAGTSYLYLFSAILRIFHREKFDVVFVNSFLLTLFIWLPLRKSEILVPDSLGTFLLKTVMRHWTVATNILIYIHNCAPMLCYLVIFFLDYLSVVHHCLAEFGTWLI